MQEKEFNLLEEPWIRVMTPDLKQKEVSLIEAISHAHEYKDLSGEMPTQDAAMLRVLLAVVETIFYRYDAEGNTEELSRENGDDSDTVLERWKDYWEKGRFPEQTVRKYLESYQERFWLFHPETPFWQVSNLEHGTEYGAECLFGNIKESMNKATKHHFSMVDGEELSRLTCAEAARWLIHLNAYAINIKTDKAAHGPGEPAGIGILGQLGFVMVNRESLFQILMLNLCPLRDGNELWKSPKPLWEKPVCKEQGRRITQPDNLPELYTTQSRRIMLRRNREGYITGFRALSGDFYSMEDGFQEQMTLWRKRKAEKKGENPVCIPQLHNPAVHAWREFPTLLQKEKKEEKRRIPGLIQWLELLKQERILSEKWFTFRTIGMVYGDKMNYTYGDCVNDTLTLSAGFLGKLGKEWVDLISDEIENCQEVATDAIRQFSNQLCELFYGSASVKSGIKDKLISRYYFSIDKDFREWLIKIDPEQDDHDTRMMEWKEKSYQCARRVAEEYIATLGPELYTQKIKDGRVLTVPQILNLYFGKLHQIYPQIKEQTKGKR